MITLYTSLKFLHVLGAAIWLGSDATTLALRASALRSGEHARTSALIRETDRVQRLLVSPAVGMLLATGVWLVLEGGWGFDRLFVLFALSAIAVSAVFGTVYTLPAMRKLERAIRTNGLGSDGFEPLVRQVQFALGIDLVLVTAVVFVMVTKPTL